MFLKKIMHLDTKNALIHVYNTMVTHSSDGARAVKIVTLFTRIHTDRAANVRR